LSEESAKPPLSRVIADRVALLSVVVLLFTVFGRVGRWWWVFDLASHFAVQLLLAAVVLSLLALWARAWYWLALSCTALLVNAVQVVPLYVGHGTTSTGTPMRVLAWNVLATNQRTERIVEYVQHSDADVILVQEVSPQLGNALSRLGPSYRVVDMVPRLDNFGIALLSRIEGVEAKVVPLGTADIPAIEATITWEGREWKMLGVHILPPVSAELAVMRNRGLAFILAWMKQQTGLYFVVGDFNVTPYSPHFASLMNTTGARNSMRGFGPQATWPQRPWFLLPMQIPIDHLLHGPKLVTMLREVGPSFGSDHRALIATLAVAR
jgi:endonuclease/exonuclease/phosphatase (EEP) superfamily protein YafD